MLMCFGAHSFAAEATSQASVDGAEKSWGLDLGLSQNSKMIDRSDEDYETYTDLSVVPSVALGRVNLAANFGATKMWVDDQELTLSDSRLDILAKGHNLGSGFGFSYPAFVTLPTSKESRVTRSLQASFATKPTLSFDFSKIGLRGLKASYGITFSRNIHKYDTGSDNKSNTQYGISQGLAIEQTFLKKFSLSLSALQRNSFSYSGALSQSYRHEETLSYALSDSYSVAIGHTNEGSALKPNGQESANVLDRNKSEFYLGMNASF